MPVLIGTSGWQYRDWRGGLYPPGVAQRRWLEHYATQYLTVENNSSFYRLPGGVDVRGLAGPHAGRLRDGGEGEPLPDPRPEAARPG